MAKQFDIRIFGAGYMGSEMRVQATAEQIEGRDNHVFWNTILRKGTLPIGNVAGWQLISAEVRELDPKLTCNNKTFHNVVVVHKGQPLVNGETGKWQESVIAMVFAEPGEIEPTVLL